MQNKTTYTIWTFIFLLVISFVVAIPIPKYDGYINWEDNKGNHHSIFVVKGFIATYEVKVNEYPTFSNFLDNSGINSSQEANFKVNVNNSNRTVYLKINNVNYLATILSENNYEVTLNLSEGDYEYYWFSYGNDTYESYGSSELRNFNVSSIFPVNGLLSYYKLDNNDFTDYYGSNDGSNYGSINTSGKIIDARNFDSNDDFVDIGSFNNFFAGNDEMTASLWFKRDSASENQEMLASDNGLLNMRQAGTSNKAAVILTTNGIMGYVASTTDMGYGEWHHLLMRYNGTTLSIWFDGVEENAVPLSGAIDTSTNSLFIGKRATTEQSGMYFGGAVDELGIWNRALTAEEISKLYNSGEGLSYPFEE